MKARDLSPEHYGRRIRIAVQSLPMGPGSVGHRHTQTLTLARVDHGPLIVGRVTLSSVDRVRCWDEGNPYYQVFSPDAEVEFL